MDKDALIAALHKADAAGDTEGATHLARALRQLQDGASAPEPTPPPEPETPAATAPKGLLDNVAEGAGNFVRGVTRLPGAAADLAGNFGRGVERIAKGDVSLKEAGDVARAELNSIPGADFAGAAGRTIAQAASGQKIDPAAALEAQRAQHAADTAAMPIASESGKLAGSIAAASAIEGRAAQAGVTGAAKRAALAAGGTELADSGDVGKATGAAAAGAVGGKVLETIAKPIIGMIKSADIPLGIKVLAKRLKMDPTELEANRQEIKQLTGRNASIAELADPKTVERLRPVVTTQPAVTEAATAARDAAEMARPGNLRAAVANGQTLTDPAEILARRDDAFNALVNPVRDKPGIVSPSEAKLLLHKDAYRSIDDATRDRLITAVESGKPTFITVGQADSLRRTLGQAVNAAAKDGANLGPLKTARSLARMIGERTAPEYKQAMSAYERGGDLAKGAAAGEKVRTADTTATVNAAGRANADQAMGLELGSRNALANDVGNSFGSSGRAAEQLQDPGLKTRVAANMGQAEADRLANVGRVEGKAAENLDRLAPSPLPKQPTTLEDARTAMKPVLALSGRGSMGFVLDAVAGVAKRLASRGISAKAAKALADDLLNPAKSKAAIKALHNARLIKDAHDAIAAKAAAIGAGAIQGQGDQ